MVAGAPWCVRFHADGYAPAMTPDPASRRRNPLGLASLVVGVLLLVLGIIVQTVTPVVPRILQDLNLPYSAISLVIAGPQAIVAALATVLGVIGLLLRERKRVAAIIGTTLGASHLLVMIVGMLGAGVVTLLQF